MDEFVKALRDLAASGEAAPPSVLIAAADVIASLNNTVQQLLTAGDSWQKRARRSDED